MKTVKITKKDIDTEIEKLRRVHDYMIVEQSVYYYMTKDGNIRGKILGCDNNKNI